jgi:hypothetical protein
VPRKTDQGDELTRVIVEYVIVFIYFLFFLLIFNIAKVVFYFVYFISHS